MVVHFPFVFHDAQEQGNFQALAAVVRPTLLANQTVNVPSDFATLDLALAYAASIDLGGIFTLTIQLAAGTYNASPVFQVPVCTGQGLPRNLLIQGDTTTPANVVLHGATNFAGIVECSTGAKCRIQGVRLTGPANAFGLRARNGGYIEYTSCDFNSGLFSGLESENGGTTACVGSCSFSASAVAAVYASNGGYAFQVGSTVVTAGTPAWTAGYAFADGLGFLQVNGATFSGTGATGPRFASQRNSVIDVAGAGLTYLPGNAAGTTATGGLYS